MEFAPPKTKTVDVVENIHGVAVNDPYRWLEEDNEEVGEWVKGQNEYTRKLLDNISAKKVIRKRLRELYKTENKFMPVIKGGKKFFRERKKGQDHPVLYVQDLKSGKIKSLLDPNTISKDKTITMRFWKPSNDGKTVAYGLSESGKDQSCIMLIDVESGKDLRETIPKEFYPNHYYTTADIDLVWKPDSTGFYYSRRPLKVPKGEELFHQKLFFHKLGTGFEDDEMVFGESIGKYDLVEVFASKDGKYLLITVVINDSKGERTEIYLKDLEKNELKTVVSGINAIFRGKLSQDKIYIKTNHNAPNWELRFMNFKDVEKGLGAWRVLISEGNDVLNHYLLAKESIFVECIRDAYSVIKRYDPSGKFIKEIKMPVIGSVYLSSGESDKEVFLSLTSFLYPSITYKYDLENDLLAEVEREKTDFSPEDFEVNQIWCHSKDNVKVPMFIVHKKGINLDGENPAVLYGYGGFNISLTPFYQHYRIPFLEKGGVYALANIRGGGELGEKWHRDGILYKKQNSFDDFIAAAEWLIKNSYTTSEKLAIYGGSNGGLLTGAAMTQRPELFKAVISAAPVMDMARFHKHFEGRLWISDFGDPEDKEDFKRLLAYSPYHNIKKGKKYPAVLVMNAENDDRVHPLHAYKFTARLQAENDSGNPILLRTEKKAGHSHAIASSKLIEEFSDLWAFVFWQLGIK